jgi:hypothetical protein
LFSDALDVEAQQIKVEHLEILDRFFHATDVRSIMYPENWTGH